MFLSRVVVAADSVVHRRRVESCVTSRSWRTHGMTARADGARRRLDDDGVGRYYDPATGQFLTIDPVVEATQEPYSYVADDPVDDVDPLGAFKIHALGVTVNVDSSGVGVSVDPAQTANDLVTAGARGLATFVADSPAGQVLNLTSRLTGKTIGVCASGDAFAGGAVHLGTCYIATPSGNSGLTFSAGGGFGAPVGASAFLGPVWSNAKNLNQLGGPFAYGWGSAGFADVSGGVTGEVGTDRCGRTIALGGVGWTPNLDLPENLTGSADFPGFAYGGGAEYTWTAASYG